MQYNISINQKAVISNECFKDLDLTDLALFDFIYHFFNCDIADKITFRHNDKEYVEIRHQLIEKEMPLLKFGCRKTFIGRMSKLVSAGLISRYENNSKENRSGYCRGENFSKMVFAETKEDNKHPVTLELQGCHSEVTDSVTTELHNHSNKDNIDIKQHSKERIDKSIPKKVFDFKQALLDLGVDEDVANDWLAVRKKKKATNSERAFNKIKGEIEKSGISANECITIAADRCWMGFEADWAKNTKRNYNNQQKYVSSQERNETLKPDMPILNEDGDLMDGTFFKQNARWYISEIDAQAHSIPIKAPQRPDSRYEWDSVNNRWYLPIDKWSASDEIW